MYQHPPLHNNKSKDTYSAGEVARMFGTNTERINDLGVRSHCGIRISRFCYYNLGHIERLYEKVTDDERKHYDRQFK